MQIFERAVEGTLGLGTVAVEEFELAEAVEAGGIGLVGLIEDFEFTFGVGALTTPEIPASEDGVCNKSGVLGCKWLVRFKRFGEQLIKLLGVLAEDEKLARGAAVFEAVEAGQRRAGESNFWLDGVNIFALHGNDFRYNVAMSAF